MAKRVILVALVLAVCLPLVGTRRRPWRSLEWKACNNLLGSRIHKTNKTTTEPITIKTQCENGIWVHTFVKVPGPRFPDPAGPTIYEPTLAEMNPNWVAFCADQVCGGEENVLWLFGNDGILKKQYHYISGLREDGPYPPNPWVLTCERSQFCVCRNMKSMWIKAPNNFKCEYDQEELDRLRDPAEEEPA